MQPRPRVPDPSWCEASRHGHQSLTPRSPPHIAFTQVAVQDSREMPFVTWGKTGYMLKEYQETTLSLFHDASRQSRACATDAPQSVVKGYE